MKSDKYWERRSGEQLIKSLKDSDKLLRDLKGSYEYALDNIKDEIKKLYGEFANENEIDIEKVQEYLDRKQFKKWKISVEDYLEEITEDSPILQLELNVLCMRRRITRLQALEAEIVANMTQLAKVQEEKTTEHLSKVLENTYYNNMYGHYKDSNRKIIELMHKHQVKLAKNDIEKIIKLQWKGRNYSESIWRREFNIAHKVKNLVTDNIMTGKSIDRLTNELTEVLGSDYRVAAKNLIQSETAFIKSQGDLLTYEKLGFDKYRFTATLDTVTSAQCREHDNKIYNVSEAVPGENYPPLHARCRSTTTVVTGNDSKGTRVARDENGNTYKVDKNLSYNDWYKQYVDKPDNKGYKDTEIKYKFDDESNVAKKLGEHRETVEQMLSESNRDVQKLFKRFEDRLKIVDTNIKKTAYYSGMQEGIFFNLEKDAQETDKHFKFETLFHELGHNLDALAGKGRFTHASVDNEFNELVKNEVQEYMRKIDSELKEKFKENKGDIDFYKSLGIPISIQSGGTAKYKKVYSRWLIGNELKKGGYRRTSNVSDIFEGGSEYKVFGTAGHGQAYWKYPSRVGMEAFAHFTSATIANPEALEEIKKYLPKSYDEYLKIVKNLIKED